MPRDRQRVTLCNGVGVNVFLEQEVEPVKRQRSLELLRDAGVGWIRQQLPWEQIEPVAKGDTTDPKFGDSTWAKYDDIMPDWFESYVGLEQATSLIRTFELQFVPGLFQTEDYARGVTMLGHRSAPSDEIEHRVSLRMQRQKILHLDDSPRIWAVIDESALRRPLGGAEAMKVQLRHLIEVTEYPRVTLQVMPFSRGGHPAAGGSFTVLRFAEPDLPDIVYLEQLTSALYLDRRDEVDHYMEVMNRLSAEADTPADSARLLEQIAKSL